jgi:hypothetical protein
MPARVGDRNCRRHARNSRQQSPAQGSNSGTRSSPGSRVGRHAFKRLKPPTRCQVRVGPGILETPSPVAGLIRLRSLTLFEVSEELVSARPAMRGQWLEIGLAKRTRPPLNPNLFIWRLDSSVGRAED